MTWQAKTGPARSVAEWTRGFDASVVPRPVDLTNDEAADFLRARDSWMGAATFLGGSPFVVQYVSGDISGHRAFGRPHITMTFDVVDETPPIKVEP